MFCKKRFERQNSINRDLSRRIDAIYVPIVTECFDCGCIIYENEDNFVRVDSEIVEEGKEFCPESGFPLARHIKKTDIYMCKRCRTKSQQTK